MAVKDVFKPHIENEEDPLPTRRPSIKVEKKKRQQNTHREEIFMIDNNPFNELELLTIIVQGEPIQVFEFAGFY